MMKKEHFDVVLADDECSRRIHYQLRYQVFCLDTGYEDPGAFPDGEEKDEWDKNAVHFLVRERETQQWVAAMRLVFPQDETLPIKTRADLAPGAEVACEDTLEISRLCMVGHHRRRPQSRATPSRHSKITNLFPPSAHAEAQSELRKRMRTAEVLRSLLDAAVAYSRECGTRHWYIFTTRALAKVLGYVLPLQLQQVGEPVWHRGERYPFLVNIEHLFDEMMAGIGNFAMERRPAFYRHSELMEVTMARAAGGM